MDIALLASGGVDSAVATHLMCEQGEKPSLFYIKIGADEETEFSCTMEEDLEMVRLLARQYGLSLEVIDLHRDYWSSVVTYLLDRVRRGLTPNPDVMCNSLIKFGCFYEKAGRYFDLTVTGHYATTVEECGVRYLATARDPVKDQTDFLCQISPEQLQRLHFPVGGMMKQEVRSIADRYHLAPAHRRDSQGICFLGNTNYNALLRHYLGDRPGDIIEEATGRVLGQHQGYWYFTIGQRKGLRLGGGPWFVTRKDIDHNVIYVTDAAGLSDQQCQQFSLADFHPIGSDRLSSDSLPRRVYFKIRHSPEFETGMLDHNSAGYTVCADHAMQGVAPGQFAVIYLPYADGRKLCLGSGEIAARM